MELPRANSQVMIEIILEWFRLNDKNYVISVAFFPLFFFFSNQVILKILTANKTNPNSTERGQLK